MFQLHNICIRWLVIGVFSVPRIHLSSQIEDADLLASSVSASHTRGPLRRHAIPAASATYPLDEAKRQGLAAERQRLPIVQYQDQILAAMAQHRVVILDGVGRCLSFAKYLPGNIFGRFNVSFVICVGRVLILE